MILILAAGKTARSFQMKKNVFWGFGALAVLLALGLVLAGCPTDTPEEDTWSTVTSLDQMNGTWKVSYSQTQSMEDFFGPSGEEEEEDDMAAMFGDMKVTTRVDMTMTLNASAKTRAVSGSTTMTFSGSNIAAAWGMLKAFMGSEDGATVNDANHSISMPYNQPAEAISDDEIVEMLALGIQKNQNGTKLKFPANSTGGDNPEMIFTKQ
jgi:hypothetical protein